MWNALHSWEYQVASQKAAAWHQATAVLPDPVLFNERLAPLNWKEVFQQWKDRVNYWYDAEWPWWSPRPW